MMEKRQPNIFSDWLGLLGVPHTVAYSDGRFEGMAFKSLFGLQQLLKEYGIDSEGFRLKDKSELSRLVAPFIAVTPDGMVIVTSLPDTGADGALQDGEVGYMTQGVTEKMPLQEFLAAWDGTVFCAYPSAGACEPDYTNHRRDAIMTRLRDYGIVIGVAFLFVYLFISNGIWRHLSTVLVALFDIVGLGLTYMLVQKSLKIKNRAADKVCGLLEEGGCDTVLEMKASKFFGIFGWSEVGFAYFSISLLVLLMFPGDIGALALCNLCCLPFTFWSIWYQKFRAKVWCTLCVSVQCTLWLLFFCYLGGGWLKEAFPISISFFVIGILYVTALLVLNKILPRFGVNE